MRGKDVETYRHLLLKCGVPVALEGKDLEIVRRAMTAKANPVAASDDTVARAVEHGQFGAKLIAPPDIEVLGVVRDAAHAARWIADARQEIDALGRFEHELVMAAEAAGLKLGPRSSLCKQDRRLVEHWIAPDGGSWGHMTTNYSPKGEPQKPGEPLPCAKQPRHDAAKGRDVSVDLPDGLGYPEPVYLDFYRCVCGSTWRHVVAMGETRFMRSRPGVTVLPKSVASCKRHSWDMSRVPLPDRSKDGVCGFASIKACLRCQAAEVEAVEKQHLAELLPRPFSMKNVRPGLTTNSSHAHAWDPPRTRALSLCCMTCDATIERMGKTA
jgi:hypothetical protein